MACTLRDMRARTLRWTRLPRLLCRRRHSTSTINRSDDYDVVIAGGGIMGCASAYFLAKRILPSSICVLERDSKVRFIIMAVELNITGYMYVIEEPGSDR